VVIRPQWALWQQCSDVCGPSRPHPELTVSGTLPTSKRTENRSPNDRFQSTADIADRRRAAKKSLERQISRGRRHTASKVDRMTAAQDTELTLPTPCGHPKRTLSSREADIGTLSSSTRSRSVKRDGNDRARSASAAPGCVSKSQIKALHRMQHGLPMKAGRAGTANSRASR